MERPRNDFMTACAPRAQGKAETQYRLAQIVGSWLGWRGGASARGAAFFASLARNWRYDDVDRG
jgi:hypothetical protein